MLIRLALIVPPAFFATLVLALVPLTEQTTRTGLSEDNRLWFFLITPPLYAVMSVYVSSIYVRWFGAESKLPAWLRSFMERAERLEPDERAERGVESMARTPPSPRRLRLAVKTFLEGFVWLALTVPVYAVLLLWLRRGFYAPWESLMVAGAGVATLAWLAFLAYRLRT